MTITKQIVLIDDQTLSNFCVHPWKLIMPSFTESDSDYKFIFSDPNREAHYYVCLGSRVPHTSPNYLPRDNKLLILGESYQSNFQLGGYDIDCVKEFGSVIAPSWIFPAFHDQIVLNYPPIHPRMFGLSVEHSNINIFKKASLLYSHSDIEAMDVPLKTQTLSAICSKSKATFTHKKRVDFLNMLSDEIGDKLDWFGSGNKDSKVLNCKADALLPYKYSIVLENTQSHNWWTEKLPDAFSGYTLPIYFGCTTMADFIPNDSYVEINVFDPKQAIKIVKEVINDDIWEQRLPAIVEARNIFSNKLDVYQMIIDALSQSQELIANPIQISTQKKTRRTIKLICMYQLLILFAAKEIIKNIIRQLMGKKYSSKVNLRIKTTQTDIPITNLIFDVILPRYFPKVRNFRLKYFRKSL